MVVRDRLWKTLETLVTGCIFLNKPKKKFKWQIPGSEGQGCQKHWPPLEESLPPGKSKKALLHSVATCAEVIVSAWSWCSAFMFRIKKQGFGWADSFHPKVFSHLISK